MKTFLSVGQAAKILGVSVSTMRRWEKEGKLSADKRTFGFHRRYEREKRRRRKISCWLCKSELPRSEKRFN